MKQLQKTLLKISNQKNFIITLSLLFIMRLIFAFMYWHPDVTNHMDWGVRLFEYTPIGFYAPEANVWNFTWPNQPPGSIYIFGTVKILFDILFGLLLFINNQIKVFPSIIVTISEQRLYPAMLQIPAILFDFAIAFILYLLTKNKNLKLGRLIAILFLAIPVVWYNSAVWGQYDSIVNFFFLTAFFLAWKKRLFLSLLFIAISLYIKISLIILLPVYFFYITKKYKIISIISSFFWILLIVILLTLPFSGLDNPIHWLYKLYTERVLGEQLHVITANAFNFWAIFTGVDWISNDLPLLGKTYKFWGLVLFVLFSLPIYIKGIISKNLKMVLFSCGLVYFTAWMFLTNMHERYLYPFFIFSLPLIVNYHKTLLVYCVLAFLSLFNMYYLWFEPEIPILVDVAKTIDLKFISATFLAIYVYFFIFFFRNKSTKKL